MWLDSLCSSYLNSFNSAFIRKEILCNIFFLCFFWTLFNTEISPIANQRKELKLKKRVIWNRADYSPSSMKWMQTFWISLRYKCKRCKVHSVPFPYWLTMIFRIYKFQNFARMVMEILWHWGNPSGKIYEWENWAYHRWYVALTTTTKPWSEHHTELMHLLLI